MENIEDLIAKIDWKGIPQKEINQICVEIKDWYKDYSSIQKFSKILNKSLEPPFSTKLNPWINIRIQMVIDRYENNSKE